LGSAKANRRQPKSHLGRIFNFKIGGFCYKRNCVACTTIPTSTVEHSAQVLSRWHKFVHGRLESSGRGKRITHDVHDYRALLGGLDPDLEPSRGVVVAVDERGPALVIVDEGAKPFVVDNVVLGLLHLDLVSML
jgi:hypothetical protein